MTRFDRSTSGSSICPLTQEHKELLSLFSLLGSRSLSPLYTVSDSAPVALWVINKSCRKQELDLEGQCPCNAKRDQCVF